MGSHPGRCWQMSSWDQLLKRQAQERRKFLQSLSDKGLSLGEGAKATSMTPSGFAHMLKREGITWKRHTGNPIGGSKPRHSPDDYKNCAEKGMTIAETSAHLNVSFNAVRDMAGRHEIKFRDARKWDPRSRPRGKYVY